MKDALPPASRIGVMQGRLLPPIGDAIQAFPADAWASEFSIAAQHGFGLLEWVLHPDGYDRNPMMDAVGRAQIRKTAAEHGVKVLSCTSDTAMLWAFHKVQGAERSRRLEMLRNEIAACAEVGVRYLVVPLVDQGSIDNAQEEAALLDGLNKIAPMLSTEGTSIVFESDLPPLKLRDFISSLPEQIFGINYDIGNSASLGYDPVAEVAAYGRFIRNVHVKDRRFGGTTVPLGQGSARLVDAIGSLERDGYSGAYILQTARNRQGQDVAVACRYRDMTAGWIEASRAMP
jgi:L-ribulose-5-phosphate 3-epimerase